MIQENKDLLKFNAEGIHPADMFLNARKVAIKAVDDYVEKSIEISNKGDSDLKKYYADQANKYIFDNDNFIKEFEEIITSTIN